MKYCPKCGTEIQISPPPKFCPNCGLKLWEELPKREVRGSKSVGVATCLAALVGLFLMGFGQIYAGRVGKGLGFLFAGLALDIATLWLIFTVGWLFFGGIILAIISFGIWLWQIFDARESVREYNRKLQGQ